MTAVTSHEARPLLSLTIPVRTVSLNSVRREHYMAQHRRVKAQHAVILAALRPFGVPDPPLTITLTRIGPARLDSDNLAGSQKGVRDAIAGWLDVDDGDPRLTWLYAQEVRAASALGTIRTFSRSGRMAEVRGMFVRVEIRQP